MKKIIALALSIAFFSSNIIAMTGSDYLSSRKDGSGKLVDALLLAQIAGTLQAAKYANDWLRAKSAESFNELCIFPLISPEDSFGDFEIVVKKFIIENPDFHDKDLSELILWALIESYPCDK